MLMFSGACAGSTGGGMKVSRLVIMLKTVKKELLSYLHPRTVRKVKFNGRIVEHEVIRGINVYMIAYAFVLMFSVLIISIDNFDFTSNFTAVVATLNNIGPGLNIVGPTGNFSMYSNLSKIDIFQQNIIFLIKFTNSWCSFCFFSLQNFLFKCMLFRFFQFFLYYLLHNYAFLQKIPKNEILWDFIFIVILFLLSGNSQLSRL